MNLPPSEALDYVKEVNRLSDELLDSHTELLAQKNIRRKRELIRIIKLDLDKLTHALFEVKETPALGVLQEFFGNSTGYYQAISRRLSGERIYHVGFEIHEPLGLVLHGIHHWIEHSRKSLGANMRVRNFLRFPASAAFQKRVGAQTEIMRIWLEVNDRVLMLELFDIYRPVDPSLAGAPKPIHRNFHGLFWREEPVREHQQRLSRLFAGDEIWHYAFQVKGREDVTELHAELTQLTASNSEYFLPYQAPVYNEHDHSFHTKIVRTGDIRLELEFVTQVA